jgi:DNA modification methylase
MIIELCDIIISENRQRKDFPAKELADLKASILSKGLLHAPIVQNDGQTLVAGERRYRAITELIIDDKRFYHDGIMMPENCLPVTLLGDLDPLDIREAELEENTVRTDLTWQERAKAVAELHALRTDQAAEVAGVHTTGDTIKEVAGQTQGTPAMVVRDSLLLADHLDIPEVAKAKTQKDAIKVLRKIKETEHRADLASKFDMNKTKHTLQQGNMVELMPKLPDGYFDVIVTDPPYGMGADQFGDMASTGHNYEDTWDNAKKLYEVLAVEGFRCTKPQAHLYAFCEFSRFTEVSNILFLAGWAVWTRPIIWSKGNGMLSRPDHGPRYTYECIIFANKGDKRTVKVSSDVITISPDSAILHGAQKPVALYVDLIERSCLAGDKILDPFGGSGTVLSAASTTRTVATMFELEKQNFDIAVARLDDPLKPVIDTLNNLFQGEPL